MCRQRWNSKWSTNSSQSRIWESTSTLYCQTHTPNRKFYFKTTYINQLLICSPVLSKSITGNESIATPNLIWSTVLVVVLPIVFFPEYRYFYLRLESALTTVMRYLYFELSPEGHPFQSVKIFDCATYWLISWSNLRGLKGLIVRPAIDHKKWFVYKRAF